jgi:ATP-binding cassette, subfamily A (ABC1), member 3
VKVDYSKFLVGTQLLWSQIAAMTIKKFLYSIRNYILLIIQFVIGPLFVVITMLTDRLFEGNTGLPSLAISFKEYLQTVTTVEKGTFTPGSIAEQIFTSYQEMFTNLPNREPFTFHTLNVIENSLEDEILNRYEVSTSETNLNYMIGATIKEDRMTAWFNNQAYHTAPLSINLFNNAILR